MLEPRSGLLLGKPGKTCRDNGPLPKGNIPAGGLTTVAEPIPIVRVIAGCLFGE